MKFRFWCEQCKKMMYCNENTAIYSWLNDEIYLVELTEKTDSEFVHEGWNVCLACCAYKNSATSSDDFDPAEHNHIMMLDTGIHDSNDNLIWGDDIILFNGQYSRVFYYEPGACFMFFEETLENFDCGRWPNGFGVEPSPFYIVGNWHENEELRERCR